MPEPAPAATPFIPKTIEDLLGWAPFHDGQVQAFWREQWSANARLELEMKQLTERVRNLQNRVIFFCGAASFAGATVPTVFFLFMRGGAT